MDPNAALTEALSAADQILTRMDHGENENAAGAYVICDQAGILADRINALHDWIRGGGFLPAAWDARPQPWPRPLRTPVDDGCWRTADCAAFSHHYDCPALSRPVPVEQG
jgi:hypothetical protein